MKYKMLITLTLFVCLQVTAQKKWTPLFDGKTTNGWHTYGEKKVGAAWKVVDGSITLDPTIKEGRGDIVTDESYNDFQLELEWKIAKNGNSGIIFFVQDDKTKFNYVWATGAEMQVLDNDGHQDGKIIKHRAGNLYDLMAGPEGVAKPVGEWNKATVTNEKGKLTLTLNGVVTATTTLGDDSWKALVKQSKFHDSNDFAKIFTGHISLQDHGDAVWYRNIRIRKL
jgi:hypothetical protein